jgi:hypothetical protein
MMTFLSSQVGASAIHPAMLFWPSRRATPKQCELEIAISKSFMRNSYLQANQDRTGLNKNVQNFTGGERATA